MPITLRQLHERVYKTTENIFLTNDKNEFYEICRSHFIKITDTKKYEHEVLNEPVYAGVETFRAWMDGELKTYGPKNILQNIVNKLIAQNRKLRDRVDTKGAHVTWTNPRYLLDTSDDAAYTEDIEAKEYAQCGGTVSKLADGKHNESWGLIPMEDWVKYDRGPGPVISDDELVGIEEELEELTSSQDKAWGNITKLKRQIRQLKKDRQRLINWDDAYADPRKEDPPGPYNQRREDNLMDIFARKHELHELMRMRLQIQRLEHNNKELLDVDSVTPRPRPEDIKKQLSVDLWSRGGFGGVKDPGYEKEVGDDSSGDDADAAASVESGADTAASDDSGSDQSSS